MLSECTLLTWPCQGPKPQTQEMIMKIGYAPNPSRHPCGWLSTQQQQELSGSYHLTWNTKAGKKNNTTIKTLECVDPQKEK